MQGAPELEFSCGTRVAVATVLGRLSEYGVGANSGDNAIVERLLLRNREFAEEVLNGPVLLLRPEGAVPPCWCAAELSLWSEDRALRRANVQWYQRNLIPDVAGQLTSWAKETSWKETADACRRTES